MGRHACLFSLTMKEDSTCVDPGENMNKLLVLDRDVSRDLIRKRKRLGIDRHDEIWDGVYVMPSMPNLVHQRLVGKLVALLIDVVEGEERGEVFPGANVSDR